MHTELLDTTGLRCPQPTLKLAVTASRMKPGEILAVKGDCPTFEMDVRTWCERLRKSLLVVTRENDGITTITIAF